jgi:uncharacterized membrane protein (UPF0127 family)
MRDILCVFNATRESFLGLRVSRADTMFTRLRGLLGRIRLKPEDGIWVIPSRGIHTVGMLFAIDVVYLDAANKVIYLVENLAPFRISPLRMKCASILEFSSRTIYSSNTRLGDELLICTAEEMKDYCERDQTLRPLNVT